MSGNRIIARLSLKWCRSQHEALDIFLGASASKFVLGRRHLGWGRDTVRHVH